MEENNKLWKEEIEKDCIQYKISFEGYAKELIVKTKNRKDIDYIVFGWFNRSARKNFQQFFFKNDEFMGFRFLIEKDFLEEGPQFSNTDCYRNLPDGRPPMPEKYKVYFKKLGEQIPSLKQSLERCIEIIALAGPKYKGGIK